MREKVEKLTLKNRRPDVYKLLTELGCEFKGVDYVSINDLVLDQGIYPRDKTDWERVKLYAENMESGDIFPPLLVEEEYKVILDGNHRYYASKEIDKAVVWIEKWEVPEGLYPVVAQAVNTEEKEIDTPLTPTEKKKAILRDWEILTQYDKRTRKEIIAKVLKTSVAYVEKVLSEAGLIKSEKEELKKKAKELKEQGYTVSQIAEILNKDKSTISRWLNVAKVTEEKNATDISEPDWSDWNEYQPEEAQEQDTEERQEKPKKKNKKDKPSEYLTPTQLLERRKNDIWDIVIEIQFHFGTDTAVEILEEIYFAFKEETYKDMEIYKDRKALFEYNRR